MRKLVFLLCVIIPALSEAQQAPHDHPEQQPRFTGGVVTQIPRGDLAPPTAVQAIPGADPNRPGAALPITIQAARDTLAHPVIPYPYLAVHQHDDLMNGLNENTARRDYVPDMASLANIVINQSMRWSTFLNLYHPSEDDIIRIPRGVEIIYDVNCCHLAHGAVKFKAIAVEGTLRFDPTIDTKLTVGTIVVGTEGQLMMTPTQGHIQTIVFKGKVDKLKDPYQMTIGLITLGGKIDIQGQEQDIPYARLTAMMQERMLTVDLMNNQPLGWKVGDEIFLHGSAQKRIPRRTHNGYTVHVDAAGGFARAKIVNIDGTRIWIDQSRDELGFEPVNYIAHITRNIVLRSHPQGDRAHMMFNADTAVNLRHATLIDLGRTTAQPFQNAKIVNGTVVAGTNQNGRYPVHLHHLEKAFDVEGNVIIGERQEHMWQEPYGVFVNRNGDIQESKGARFIANEPHQWRIIRISGNLMIAPQEHQIKLHRRETSFYPVDASQGWSIGALVPNEARTFGLAEYRVDDKGIIWINQGQGQEINSQGFIGEPAVNTDGHVITTDPINNVPYDTGWYQIKMPIASPKWAITNHNGFGRVKNNVIIGAEGAGIVGEEGLETGTIQGNLVIGLGGGFGGGDDDRWWNMGLTKADLGYGGFGYWFCGAMIDVSDNVADGFFRRSAYAYYGPYDFHGAVPTLGGGWRRVPDIEGMPIELKGTVTKPAYLWKFDHNESVADIADNGHSLELTNIGATDPGWIGVGGGYMEISRYKSSNHGILLNNIDPTIVLRDIDLKGMGQGIGVNNNFATQVTLHGGRIDNFEYGIVPARLGVLVQDTVLTNRVNYHHNVYQGWPAIVKEQLLSEQLIAQRHLERSAQQETLAMAPGATVTAYVTSFTPRMRLLSFNENAFGWFALYIDHQQHMVRVVWSIHHLTNPIENIYIGLRVPSNDPRVAGTAWQGKKIVGIASLGNLSSGETMIHLTDNQYALLNEALDKQELIVRVLTSGNPSNNIHTIAELEGMFGDPRRSLTTSIVPTATITPMAATTPIASTVVSVVTTQSPAPSSVAPTVITAPGVIHQPTKSSIKIIKRLGRIVLVFKIDPSRNVFSNVYRHKRVVSH